MAAAGGLLAFTGTRISSNPQEVHAEASFTVNVTPEAAYQFWSDFENLPRFMSHLESVKVLDDRQSEWVARGPLNSPIHWKAEILDRRENQWIVWRSDPNSGFANSGSVQFRPAPGNRGTEVTVAISYMPPAGQIGKAFAKLFGKDPAQTIFEDLRHFKQLLETGEIATTVGQPHGRRSVFVKAKNAMYDDHRPKPAQSDVRKDVAPGNDAHSQSQSQPQEVAS